MDAKIDGRRPKINRREPKIYAIDQLLFTAALPTAVVHNGASPREADTHRRGCPRQV